jgi:AcrR family transcriptional regulator
MTPNPQSAASRRVSVTPVEILRATEELLLSGGIENVSIRKVSERCGYSAPTIYHHFKDKRGLIDALLEERFKAIHQLMAAIPPRSDPAHYLREMLIAFAGFALENPDHYRLLTTPLDREPEVPSADAARELVRGALEALAREGTLVPSDVEAAFQVIWAVLHGLISLQLIHRNYEFVEDLAGAAFDMVERGLLRGKRPEMRT